MSRVNIMGVGFDTLTLSQALDTAAGMVARGEGGYIVTPNPEIVYACRKDEALAGLLNGAALVVPDGIGIIHAARLLRTPLAERVPGIELGEQLAAWMARHGKRLYLLGAKPGIAERAAENLQKAYPGLRIAGTHDGYFKEDAPVVEALRAASPDVVFVCTGFPKQERFMAAYTARLPHCVMLGLGGSLDVFAGEVRRAPAFFRKCGLEWFYRLLREPKRIGRMMKLPVFLWLAACERFRPRRKGE